MTNTKSRPIPNHGKEESGGETRRNRGSHSVERKEGCQDKMQIRYNVTLTLKAKIPLPGEKKDKILQYTRSGEARTAGKGRRFGLNWKHFLYVQLKFEERDK